MVRYVNLEEQVDFDFARARHRASLRRLQARIFGGRGSTLMPSWEEVSKGLGASNRVRLGRRVVAVEKIVGSVGRFRDFDRNFLPTRGNLETKWKRMDRAYYKGQDLPPVALFRVGDSFFVEDGNHRVSVARYQGVEWIDAEVTVLYGGVVSAPVRGSGAQTKDREQRSAQQHVAA